MRFHCAICPNIHRVKIKMSKTTSIENSIEIHCIKIKLYVHSHTLLTNTLYIDLIIVHFFFCFFFCFLMFSFFLSFFFILLLCFVLFSFLLQFILLPPLVLLSFLFLCKKFLLFSSLFFSYFSFRLAKRWEWWGSNSRPRDYETHALPTEPHSLLYL